jgi:hypothetical protein
MRPDRGGYRRAGPGKQLGQLPTAAAVKGLEGAASPGRPLQTNSSSGSGPGYPARSTRTARHSSITITLRFGESVVDAVAHAAQDGVGDADGIERGLELPSGVPSTSRPRNSRSASLRRGRRHPAAGDVPRPAPDRNSRPQPARPAPAAAAVATGSPFDQAVANQQRRSASTSPPPDALDNLNNLTSRAPSRPAATLVIAEEIRYCDVPLRNVANGPGRSPPADAVEQPRRRP